MSKELARHGYYAQGQRVRSMVAVDRRATVQEIPALGDRGLPLRHPELAEE